MINVIKHIMNLHSKVKINERITNISLNNIAILFITDMIVKFITLCIQ